MDDLQREEGAFKSPPEQFFFRPSGLYPSKAVPYRSPDGAHTLSLNYEGEIRFGPAYHLAVLDNRSITGRIFGDEFLWSPDSRFLALQEWLSVSESAGPHTRLVLIDTVQHLRLDLDESRGGFLTPLRFEKPTVIFAKTFFETGEETDLEVDFTTRDSWRPI